MANHEQPQKLTEEEINSWRAKREEQKKSEAVWLKIALLPVRPLIDLLKNSNEQEE